MKLLEATCAKIAAMRVKTFAMHYMTADGATAPKTCAMRARMSVTSAKIASIAVKIGGTAARTAGIAVTKAGQLNAAYSVISWQVVSAAPGRVQRASLARPRNSAPLLL